MSRLLIVVDRAKDWAPYYPSEDVLTFDQYLQFSAPTSSRVRVINLCQSARYLSRGFTVHYWLRLEAIMWCRL